MSTFIVLSTAILLLLACPLVLSNPLLQPAQAQTVMTFKTLHPAIGEAEGETALLTFNATGTLSTNSSGYQKMNGTYQITNSSSGQVLNDGSFFRVQREQGCCLTNLSSGDKISIIAGAEGGDLEILSTSCSTSANNEINVHGDNGPLGAFNGPVECSSSSSSSPSSPQVGGGNATTTSNIHSAVFFYDLNHHIGQR